MMKKLAVWLHYRGCATNEEAAIAIERGSDSARDLPRADELGDFFRRMIDEAPPERVLEEWEDDYPTISRVEAGRIWFKGAEEVGLSRFPGGQAISQASVGA